MFRIPPTRSLDSHRLRAPAQTVNTINRSGVGVGRPASPRPANVGQKLHRVRKWPTFADEKWIKNYYVSFVISLSVSNTLSVTVVLTIHQQFIISYQLSLFYQCQFYRLYALSVIRNSLSVLISLSVICSLSATYHPVIHKVAKIFHCLTAYQHFIRFF